MHSSSIIEIDADRVDTEQVREAGPVHAGHQMWRQLGLDAILSRAGLSKRACVVSEAMTLNRLIFPLSEHAMADWIRRTAMGDILGVDFSQLNENALYRNLDRLHPNREQIERELAEREKTLFNLDDRAGVNRNSCLPWLGSAPGVKYRVDLSSLQRELSL